MAANDGSKITKVDIKSQPFWLTFLLFGDIIYIVTFFVPSINRLDDIY